MKFLVIRFSSIGDIVLTTPVIRCLKKQVADAQVHVLTKNNFANIFSANPYVDKLHLVKTSVHDIMDELKAEKFDYIIDLHHNLRTLSVKRNLKAQAFSFNKLNIEKWLLTNLKINQLPHIHIVDRYLQTVYAFGVQNDGQGLDYFIPDNERVQQKDIPATHQAGYIGWAIGAALHTKKMPLHKLQELCTQIKHPIILLGGKEDVEAAETIAAIDPYKIYNACGKFSLNESADLVRRSKFMVTNDTGLMHIAAAFQKPIISFWGNTIPQFGMYPYYGKSTIEHTLFEINNLRCRPCSKIGYKKCPKKHFNCMELLSNASILAAIERYLSLYR